MSLYDYSRWPNFTRDDLVCRYTGLENPNVEDFTFLMNQVQQMRTWAGIPFHVSSGYRSPEHPIEARKVLKGRGLGEHTRSAIDFRVPTAHCHRILSEIYRRGFTGVGVKLIGTHGNRFIHVDFRSTAPAAWSY